MDIHQHKLMQAAKKLGIEACDLSSRYGLDVVAYRLKGHEELVTYGRIYGDLRYQAFLYENFKHAGKAFMRDLGIPCPEGIVFGDPEQESHHIQVFLNRHHAAVCKPTDGTDGLAVAMDVHELAQVVQHCQANAPRFRRWLLETQVTGRDLRLQAVGGQLVAACVREPATVIGDGQSSVTELIRQKNLMLKQQNPCNCLNIDAQVHQCLEAAGLRLLSVVEAGRVVRLKKVSNMSQGARAIDVTAQIHPRYFDWMANLGKALRQSVFALDVMTDDFRADPQKEAHALEINIKPCWLHHTFSDERQHDLPTLILRHLFRDQLGS